MTRSTPTTTAPVGRMVRIRGPLRQGERVVRTPHPTAVRLKDALFWNPKGEPFEVDAELGEWVQCLLKEGSVEIVEPQPEKPTKPAPRKAADDKESR